MEVSLLIRNADNMLNHFREADACQPTRWIGHRRAAKSDDIGAELIPRAGYRPEAAFTATVATSLGGELRKGDVLTWPARGTHHLGKAVGFYELAPMAVPRGR